MSNNAKRPFGEILREKRLAMGFTLRKFAEMVDVSPTYLSQVEQGNVKTSPTMPRLMRMAEVLGENPDSFVSLAGRVPDDLPGIIQSRPEAMPDVLRSLEGLTVEQLQKVAEQARKMKKEK